MTPVRTRVPDHRKGERIMSKREKILLVIAVIAVLSFLYFNYFFSPMQKTAEELEASILENTTKAGELQGYLQNIETKKDELAQVEAQYQAESAKIPAELDQAELLMEIARIVNGRGDIASLIFMPVQKRANYTAAPVSLEIFCESYGGMRTVLAELQDSSFINLVRGMKVVAVTTEAGEEGVSSPVDMLDIVLTLDFLCLSINETEPGDYSFINDGTYGRNDLFEKIK